MVLTPSFPKLAKGKTKASSEQNNSISEAGKGRLKKQFILTALALSLGVESAWAMIPEGNASGAAAIAVGTDSKQLPHKALLLVGQLRRQEQPKQLPLVRMPLLRVLNQPLLVTIPVQQGIHPLLSAATIGISYGLNQLRQQEINRSIKSFKS